VRLIVLHKSVMIDEEFLNVGCTLYCPVNSVTALMVDTIAFTIHNDIIYIDLAMMCRGRVLLD